MVLARPPLQACGFAALGPQLNFLASSVDGVAASLQTEQIFTGLSVQSALIVRSNSVTQPINGTGAIDPVSWDAEEYRFGNALPFINGNEPTAIQNSESHRHWYYMGWYIRTAGSGANVNWGLHTSVEDFDPLTGIATDNFYMKTFLNTNSGTGEELLWKEMFFRSGGGDIQTYANQNSGGNINVGGGRFWIMQLSSQR